jgi:hypothetical protein
MGWGVGEWVEWAIAHLTRTYTSETLAGYATVKAFQKNSLIA